MANKYEESKHIIDAKHKNINKNRKKKERKGAWYSVLPQHRARFLHVEIMMEDLENKLSNLKSESKDCLMELKKSKKLTGGGKPPNEPNSA